MLRKLLTTTSLLVFLASGLFCQSRVQLRLVDTEVNNADPLACIPVVADSFPNIAAVQFALSWNTDKLTFSEVRLGDNPLDISAGEYNLKSAGDFLLTYAHPQLAGKTLAAGTKIMEVCFATNFTNDTTLINWNGSLPPEFIQEGIFAPFPNTVIDGVLTLSENTSVREPEWAADLSVFPNPAGGAAVEIRGALPDLQNIRLLDASGGTLRVINGNERTIAIDDLSTGVYLLRLQRGQEVVTRRFIRR